MIFTFKINSTANTLQKMLRFQIFLFHRAKWSRHHPSCPQAPALTGLGIVYSSFSDFCLKPLQSDWQKCWTLKAAIVVNGKCAFTCISFCLIVHMCRKGAKLLFTFKSYCERVFLNTCEASLCLILKSAGGRLMKKWVILPAAVRGKQSMGRHTERHRGSDVRHSFFLSEHHPSHPAAEAGWAQHRLYGPGELRSATKSSLWMGWTAAAWMILIRAFPNTSEWLCSLTVCFNRRGFVCTKCSAE